MIGYFEWEALYIDRFGQQESDVPKIAVKSISSPSLFR